MRATGSRMPLSAFVQPWQGVGYRTRPQGSPIAITDTRFAGTREGRWNRKGELAYYVASDVSVVVTEFARWLQDNAGGVPPQAREIFRLEIDLKAVIDLRQPNVQAALGITNLTDFMTYAKCQAYASMARVSGAEGILVPPMGALDKPDAWNLVVFLEPFGGNATFVQKADLINVVSVLPPPTP